MAAIGNFPHHGEHLRHEQRMNKLALWVVAAFLALFLAMFVLARL